MKVPYCVTYRFKKSIIDFAIGGVVVSKKTQATKTVMMLAAFSFLSKIMGFVRESLIASKYGSGSQTDAFFLALVTISMFTGVVSSSIGTTLIPVLSQVEKEEGKAGKQAHLNNFINIIGIVSLALILLAGIFAPLLLKVLAKGFEGESFELVVLLSRIGLPSIFFSAIIGVYRGYLQSEGMFRESATASLVTNVLLIIFLVGISDRFDVRALMVAYVVAQAAPLAIQWVSLKSKGYHYEYHINLKDPYMSKVLNMLPPVLIGVAISDINKMADNSMASSLSSGSVSSLQYANRIEGITMGIFIASIMTVIFPLLSSEANKEDKTSFKKVITQGTNLILLITIPAAVGMIVLGVPIIQLAFERGKFTSNDTLMAAGALTFYSVGVGANALKQFYNRAFYSLQDTKTPVINSAITVALNITLNILLVSSMEHRGLALATSLANTITSILLLYFLRKKIGAFGISGSLVVLLKSLGSSIIMGFVAHFTYEFLYGFFGVGNTGLLLSLLGSVALASLVYFILMVLLKVEELHVLIDSVKRRLKRA